MCHTTCSSHTKTRGLFDWKRTDVAIDISFTMEGRPVPTPFLWNVRCLDVYKMSARTCSYLLGNKGCHSYNGNPQSYEFESTFSEDTMKITEKRVYDSVGRIIITDSQGVESRGIGFRVGTNYLMSSYSVFKEQIADTTSIITSLLDEDKIRKEKTLLDIPINTQHIHGEVEEILKGFLRKHATNITLLLHKLQPLIHIDDITDKLNEKWKRDCKVKFQEEGIFRVHWDIKFGHEETDVIIVELEKNPEDQKETRDQSFPPPLLIDDKTKIDKHIQIIKCENPDSVEQKQSGKKTSPQQVPVIATNCPLMLKTGFVNEELKASITWWKTQDLSEYGLNKNEVKECLDKECPTDDKNAGVIIIKTSKSFTKDSSGSPMVCVLKSFRLPVVTGILLGGFPSFYYKKMKTDEENASFGDHLYEKGISTEMVAKQLEEFGKTDLKKNIFDILRQVEDKASRCGRKKRTDAMMETLKLWKKEDKECYPTKGVEATKNKILSNNCVCVSGDPGSGKSMSIRHAALYLYDQFNFYIYPISTPKEFFEHFDEKKKQVFVIDDILGIHSVHEHLKNQWANQHDTIKCMLNSETKILASLRKQLVHSHGMKLDDFIFLEKSKRIDLYDAMYNLDNIQMQTMLKCQLKRYEIQDAEEIVRKIWGTSGKDEAQVELKESASFPFLCKLFCQDENLRGDPKTFFRDPFGFLIKTFEAMKSNKKPLFWGLVLCVAFDGKLSETALQSIINEDDCFDDPTRDMLDCLSRNISFSEFSESELSSCIYAIRKKNDFEICHRIIYDIVSYVFGDVDFIVRFGTSQFIKDRVRTLKLPEDDQYVLVCEEKAIQSIANRLIKDLYPDDEIGASLIVENRSIDDDRLVGFLNKQLKPSAVNVLFRKCFRVIHENKATFKQDNDGDAIIPQLRLIEKLLERGVDCNAEIDSLWPLHIAVNAGNVQLTRLLLEKGADKRYCDSDNQSVMHWACNAKCNNVQLIKLFAERGIDTVPAIKVLAVGAHCIRKWLERQRSSDKAESAPSGSGKKQKIEQHSNVQLEEFMREGKHNKLTKVVDKMETIVNNYTGNNQLQVVEIIHTDSCLNSVDKNGQTVLHLAVKNNYDASVLKALLDLGSKVQCRYNSDCNDKKPDYWLDASCALKDRRGKRAVLTDFDAKFFPRN